MACPETPECLFSRSLTGKPSDVHSRDDHKNRSVAYVLLSNSESSLMFVRHWDLTRSHEALDGVEIVHDPIETKRDLLGRRELAFVVYVVPAHAGNATAASQSRGNSLRSRRDGV
jgi:hypothetical protein